MQYNPTECASKIAEALGGSSIPDANGNYLCRCPAHVIGPFAVGLRSRRQDAGPLLRRLPPDRRHSGAAAPWALARQTDPGAQERRLGRHQTGATAMGDRSLKTWREASPIVVGSPVEAYLRNRGLALPAGAPLRYAPSLWHWPTKTRHPGDDRVGRANDGAPITSHTTFLSRDGRKADDYPARLFAAGVSPAGGGVWFNGLGGNPELIVAEGIESALSAALLYDAEACVATLSTHGMRTLVCRRRCAGRCAFRRS